jgi:hypothetical protein
VKEYLVRFTVPVITHISPWAEAGTPIDIARSALEKMTDPELADITAIFVYDIDTGQETGIDPLDLE